MLKQTQCQRTLVFETILNWGNYSVNKISTEPKKNIIIASIIVEKVVQMYAAAPKRAQELFF